MNITFLSSLMRKVSHQKAFKKADDFWTESSRALYSKEKKRSLPDRGRLRKLCSLNNDSFKDLSTTNSEMIHWTPRLQK